MKTLNNSLLNTALGAALALSLSACTGPDTEAMHSGLLKAGLSETQAECYNGVLTEGLSAEGYNRIAGYLNDGEVLNKALNRTRRHLGGDFANELSTIRGRLSACLN